MGKKLYHEVSFHRADISETELQKDFFRAAELKLQGVCIPLSFLSSVKEFLPEGMVLACPIDYPFGYSDIKLRNSAILAAVRYGANAIDLVADISQFNNGKVNVFARDLISNFEICKDNGVTLRIMMDYRHTHRSSFFNACSVIKDVGIDYIFPSTGLFVDDPIDNILMGIDVMKNVGLQIITNGNIYLPEHYKAYKDSAVFGIRFRSIKTVEHAFGV